MTSALSAINVTKAFGNKTILEQVSIDIEKGDFVSITGASGSGKSTLLTILGGIDRATSGEVVFKGLNLTNMKERDLAKLRRTTIGFVFQFFNLAPYLTARENIMLPIILDGKSQKSFKEKVDRLGEYLGITDQLHKLPANLSGGEQQRVAIARGLIFDPEIILLDEPTGNLDAKSGVEIMEHLARINTELKTTIIQVTHSAKNVAYGNRIIVISDGKIIDSQHKKEEIS
jgi:putative ABC transport system ATP-binding protein